MFAVIFEVNPKPEQWEAYLGYAELLRPELEQTDGFIENERFSSLRREGWLLSLSIWRDEKAVIRWRTVPVTTKFSKRAGPRSSAIITSGSERSSPITDCLLARCFASSGLTRRRPRPS